MPKLTTAIMNHNQRTAEWKQRIDDMENLFIPSEITEYYLETNKKEMKINGKYNRFVGYTQMWLLGVASNSFTLQRILPVEERFGCGVEEEFPKNWWNLAIKAGKGGKISEEMPDYIVYGTDEEKEEIKGSIYDKFMPAYRAIRESFKSRPWYQWITNHAQYTAERDTMNAIRGMMMTLTGDSKETFDKDYIEYHKHVTLEAEETDVVSEDEAVPQNEVVQEKTRVVIHNLDDNDRSYDFEPSKEDSRNSSLDNSTIKY